MHVNPFKRAAAEAVASALGVDPELFSVTAPPDPSLGDLAVGCFPAAKALRAAPPQLAQKVVAAFRPTDRLAGAQAAGPYVNFRVERAALFRHVIEGPLVPGDLGAGKTVCVDFSSPNIAKPLAYHHIRSTVLGNAIGNLHRALGYRVVGINHLGDWGTTFGLQLEAWHRFGAPPELTVETLAEQYRKIRALAKEDPGVDDAARGWFKRLEDGDPAARELWRRFRDVSLAEFQEIYDLLGIRFDEVKGESEYEGAIPGVIALLERKGLLSLSEDALVVDLSELGMPPCLIRKKDGATLYATRDLAAAIYRWETYGFTRSLYVVDKGQALHFKQLIAVLEKAGHDWAKRMEHVQFGLVRIGGKKSGTRAGNVILLREVLGEAQARIEKTIAEKNPELDAERRRAVARDVGVGAIMFANLASQREKDVDFELEAVLSFEGDAGPYVQYAHARTASILRRAGGAEPAGADLGRLGLDEEWALAKLLSELGEETARAAAASEPHVIARWLLDVCAAFSRWYTLGNQDPALKVLCPDAATARARLALTDATARALRTGLGLIGMAAPEEM